MLAFEESAIVTTKYNYVNCSRVCFLENRVPEALIFDTMSSKKP